jgi:hypothetical protein
MAQVLFTKKFGEIEVEKSWQEGTNHIALLTNGAYVYITGVPVRTKAELRGVMDGADLAAAEHWFDHRHDDAEQAPRRIMFEADGSPVFEDGTPVESPSDLVQSLKPGPVLDAALMALATKMAARKVVEAKKQQAGEKVKDAAAEVKATKRVAEKVTAPKKTGMRRPAAGRRGKPATVHTAPPPPVVAPAQITV